MKDSIYTQDLGTRRRLIEEGATLIANHRCGSECGGGDWTESYQYELFGRTFEVLFPACWHTCYWTGGMHTDWLSEMFGVEIAKLRHMEHLWEQHTRGPVKMYKLPFVLERGPWRYYCLRDVVRSGAIKRTRCIYCGGRCRGVDDFNLHWRLARPIRKISEFDYEYEYWCSEECKKRFLRRESRQQQQEEQRQRQERLWIGKGRQTLLKCRKILRETRNSLPLVL